MLAGGGLRGGQVVGATNAKAEHPVRAAAQAGRPAGDGLPRAWASTRALFKDHTGRPIPILDEGKPIAEVI